MTPHAHRPHFRNQNDRFPYQQRLHLISVTAPHISTPFHCTEKTFETSKGRINAGKVTFLRFTLDL